MEKHEIHNQIYKDKEDYNRLIIAGRSWGKSSLIRKEVVRRILTEKIPGNEIYCFYPRYKLRRLAFQDMLEDLLNYQGLKIILDRPKFTLTVSGVAAQIKIIFLDLRSSNHQLGIRDLMGKAVYVDEGSMVSSINHIGALGYKAFQEFDDYGDLMVTTTFSYEDLENSWIDAYLNSDGVKVRVFPTSEEFNHLREAMAESYWQLQFNCDRVKAMQALEIENQMDDLKKSLQDDMFR